MSDKLGRTQMNVHSHPEKTERSLRLPIEGMSCASCVRRVETAIGEAPGVTSASVNLATGGATVSLAPGGEAGPVIAAIEKAGYAVPLQRFELGVDGMTCASCVSRVERAVAAVPGVIRANVNLATERAAVEAWLAPICFPPSRPRSAPPATNRAAPRRLPKARMPTRKLRTANCRA
jgi:copper ion binding protein